MEPMATPTKSTPRSRSGSRASSARDATKATKKLPTTPAPAPVREGPNPLAAEVERLKRRTARLEADLARAHKVIEIQGKVSELLGIPLARSEDDGSGS